MSDAREQLTHFENLSRQLATEGMDRSFLDAVMLLQDSAAKAEKGDRVDLTDQERRLLYILQGNLTTLYFLDAPGCGVMKIGKSGSLDKRLASLRTQSPVKLELLFTIDYDDTLEARVHKYLADYRSHGEWFFVCKPVKDFIRGYMDNGLPWLVERVGDAPAYWMNARRGIPDEWKWAGQGGGQLRVDMPPDIVRKT